jgi:hypothetical protein
MSTDIVEIFNRKYDAEIIKIAPKKREEILRSAELFICKKFADKFSLDGGKLSEINLAVAQSLLETFVRDKAAKNMQGSMLRIDLSIYVGALEDFKEYINANFPSYELLEAFWLQQALTCVCNAFSASTKVLKTYLIGELCENLYIDNKTASAVIDELKNRRYIDIYGKQRGQELIIRKTNK